MKRTDPLNRVTQFQWCKSGGIQRLMDPRGRTTTWRNDAQGRVTAKVYADGSEAGYVYEDTTSRLRQRIDEKLQATHCSYNRDKTLSGIICANATVATPRFYMLMTKITSSDSDGVSNQGECPAGTDPFDASSVFRILHIEGVAGEARVEFVGTLARRFQLERSVGLGNPAA